MTTPVEKLNARLEPWAELLGKLKPLVAFALGAVAIAFVLATDGGKAAACRLYHKASGTQAETWTPVRNTTAYHFLALEGVLERNGKPSPDRSSMLVRKLSADAYEYAWRAGDDDLRYAVAREDGVWVVNALTPDPPGWCARRH